MHIKDRRVHLSKRKIKTQPSCPVSTNFAHGILSCPSQCPSYPCQRCLHLQVLYVYLCQQFHLWPLSSHSAILIPQPPSAFLVCLLLKYQGCSCPPLASFLSSP